MNTLEEFIKNKSPEEINGIFIEQQTRFNRYVKLNYDCHGPLLQLSDFHDCYTVFTEPITIIFQKRKKKHSAAAGAGAAAAGALDDNYLNITGHFELHSSITALLQGITDRPSSLDVKLEDYIDFLLPFRRSVDLKINHHDAGWTIDDDQRINVGEHNGLVMTDGNVRLKKHGTETKIPFHVLLVNNLDIFTQFQNKVNIISGHNLSLSLVDENTLLFIYELLTDTTLSSKNRSERLKEIIEKLNETHQRVVNQTVSQLLYQINHAADAAPAAPAAATVEEHYLPDELRVLHPSYPEPETEFKISVAQLSSTPKYYSMSCRSLLGGLSVVGTSDDDKFTCDKDQTVITDKSLIPLVESLAFTISFRVDMRYNGDAYLFSFKLDREILNQKIVKQKTGGKCVFKHSDIVQHIVSESWKRCVIGALDKKASSLSRQREKHDTITNIKDGIEHLWSERTIDLILDSCVVIDRCFKPSDEFTSSRLNLDFYSKVKGRDGDDSLILLPNPKDSHTRTSIVSLFHPDIHPDIHPDPVVNVYVRFSEIDVNDVLSAFLSKAPYTSEVVRWIDAVNDYDESISTTLLQYNQGNDLSSVFSSVSRSLSRSLSLSRSPSHSRGHDKVEREHKGMRDRSIDPPTSSLNLDNIRLLEHEQPITLEILKRYIDELPDGKSTQIPPNDCVSERGAASAPVGYFTRFKSALKDMITFLFSRPTRDDDNPDMGGGHKPQKNTNTTIRRRNKKQSRKKYRYRIKQVKTKQRNKRKRTTYKK